VFVFQGSKDSLLVVDLLVNLILCIVFALLYKDVNFTSANFLSQSWQFSIQFGFDTQGYCHGEMAGRNGGHPGDMNVGLTGLIIVYMY
jgi:hypothetical protein